MEACIMVSLRRMAQQCVFLLILLAITTRVHSQPSFDSNGFLSIDCGLSGTPSYVDTINQLTYYSDDNFTDTGANYKISSSYGTEYQKEFLTVRSFPNGTRNCYTIRSLTKGSNYLIRATFFYANYDNLKKPPIFDIYLGVDFWYTVDASDYSFPEIIISATTDFLDVCLVNKNQGYPFISSLHVRKFEKGMYTYVNSTTSLILVSRRDLGGNSSFISYPEDKYDRWWRNYTESGWNEISFDPNKIMIDDAYRAPSAVLQTAVTSSSTLKPLTLTWKTDNSSVTYYFILHFYDTKHSTGQRELNAIINGNGPYFDKPYNYEDSTGWFWFRWTGYTYYNVSVVVTPNSTLPPLLNAFELYTSSPVGVSTYAEDVAAISNVKGYYKIKKGWSGDPCFPKQFLWTGINCSLDLSSTTRIISLDLSSSLLSGSLSDSIGNLSALQSLYLSNNNLSGSLPTSLDNLLSLKLLDIRGNPLISTNLPPVLEKRRQSGFLNYLHNSQATHPPLVRYGDNPSPSPSPSRKKNVTIIATAVAVPLLVIAVVAAIILVLKRKNYKHSVVQSQNRSYQPNPLLDDSANYYANIPPTENPIREPQRKGAQQIFPRAENRRFSYSDLKKITNDFENNIGTGGYGSVYLGHLENGLQIAVKMLSQSSHQGVKEFLAEAENLGRVHHKNLVTLIGYCTDKSSMALVYEYMQEGNLRDKLKDKAELLSWKQRLQIAYESAQGLEYLHNACNPPLIHRDVKTSNILLNANLEAKIADFGLSRAFDKDMSSHVSTRIVGTAGYMDPEYYLSNQLSAKSDVFSFGVVLLEIITGQAPTGAGIEGGSLVQWVRHKLSGGDIESIVDPKIWDKYDINSVWKVTDLACKCTEPTSSERPTMSAVVSELKESLDLEMSMKEIHGERTDNLSTDVSQNSTIEMAYRGGMPMKGPSVR